ncbi:hypothetical protein BH23BAC1_BH23BAC1_44730 [soil metagenome]
MILYRSTSAIYLFLIAFLGITSPSISQHLNNSQNYHFIPNQNQWESEVLFKADIPGGKIFLQKNAFTYAFYDAKMLEEKHEHQKAENVSSRTGVAPVDEIRMHAVEIEFLNANPEVNVSGHNPGNINYNYYLGNNAENWASGLTSSTKIIYKEIYPLTNLIVYSTSQGLKYDLTLAPGANPSIVKLRYNGADGLALKDGNLLVKTSLQSITELKPFAYQLKDKDTVRVACNYELAGQELSFAFPDSYNKNLPLIIDPLLIFSTYSGSSADNWGFTATYDEAGNLYSAGLVFNTGFPATAGAYRRQFSGNLDIGVLKFDSTGANLLYATYLGGNQAEVPKSLIVNNQDELVLLGSTSSANFPTSLSAFSRTFKGGSQVTPIPGVDFINGSDLVLCRFNSNGSQLLASTYVGGSSNDGIMRQLSPLTKNYGDQFRGELMVDNNNNVYVASHTSSTDFPVSGAFQPVYGGGAYDGVVFKMNSGFNSLTWSSFIGGEGADAAYSIKLNEQNQVLLAGGTNSNNFPATNGSLHSSRVGGIDGFVAKIAANGASIIHSTFIGTENYDQVYLLDLDEEENVYILGQTLGNYPISENIYHNQRGGHFIHKLSADLSSTIFSTVFGSGNNRINISPTAFLVNECENIFISGWGGIINAPVDFNGVSTGYLGGDTYNLPVTEDAFQKTTDGTDFYLMVLAKDASSLLYGSYFGGDGIREHVDGGTSRFNKKGIIYQAVCGGCGGSSDFPTTPGAWSETNNSNNCNNAAFKFDLATLKANFVTNTLALDQEGINDGCASLTILFQNRSIGGKTFYWDFGDGTFSENGEEVVHTYDEPGTYNVSLKAVDLNTCKKEDFAYGTIKVYQPFFSVGEDVTICEGESIQLAAGGGINYTWLPAEGLNNPNLPNPMANPATTTTYYVSVVDKNRCTYEDSVKVTVIPEVVSDFEYEIINGCESLPVIRLTNKSIGAEEIIWSFGDGQTSREENPVHPYEEGGTYKISLTVGNEMCVSVKEVELPLQEFLIPNVFTPNGDNFNDVFEIKANVTISLKIFNRWGKEIYYNPDYRNDWEADGFPPGIYFYEVSLPDLNICKGWLQVMH